tara:strand:- start:45 stop:302 length:258 start_codon:yes stop_codon:yes gene_type:complete
MNLNEITFVIIICWSSLALLWLYIKFKRRNLPTFEQALSLYGKSSGNLSLLLKEQSEHLNRRITDLIQERYKLLEDYDEPDKTLH